jgi:hypothetical protein
MSLPVLTDRSAIWRQKTRRAARRVPAALPVM